jgi:tetratricopeptide (TPR) repeat protein
VYPATYDFAASHAFNPAEVPSPSIFYLHGQRSGFALMNTETECRRQAKILKPVFEDAGRGRVWIVVGYSGENDPVFTHLSQVPRFDHNLYWIGYQKADPPIHVTEKLLSDERYAFNVSGYNADGFFITLAQRLGCFPPQIVSDPFTHLDSLLQGVCDFPVSEQKDRLDPVISTRSLLRAARQVFKTDPGARRFDELKRPYVQGKYDQVIKLARKHSDLTAREKHLFISSLLMKATLSSHVVLKRRLRTTRGRLHSIEKLIREALRMSQSGETLGSVGRTLLATSYGYPENEALRIVRRALTLLTKASKITPHGNLYNLACAQSRLGDAKKAKMLLEEALAKDEDMPGSTHVQRDPDFASMRSAAWFQKFLGKLAVRKKGIRQRELPRKIRRR